MGARVDDPIHVQVQVVKLDPIRVGFGGVLRDLLSIVSVVLLQIVIIIIKSIHWWATHTTSPGL